MPTVVLVGFSTTGKSTLANTFKTRYPLDNLQVMDTDTHIARRRTARADIQAHPLFGA